MLGAEVEGAGRGSRRGEIGLASVDRQHHAVERVRRLGGVGRGERDVRSIDRELNAGVIGWRCPGRDDESSGERRHRSIACTELDRMRLGTKLAQGGDHAVLDRTGHVQLAHARLARGETGERQERSGRHELAVERDVRRRSRHDRPVGEVRIGLDRHGDVTDEIARERVIAAFERGIDDVNRSVTERGADATKAEVLGSHVHLPVQLARAVRELIDGGSEIVDLQPCMRRCRLRRCGPFAVSQCGHRRIGQE